MKVESGTIALCCFPVILKLKHHPEFSVRVNIPLSELVVGHKRLALSSK